MYYNGCFFTKNPSQALSGTKTTHVNARQVTEIVKRQGVHPTPWQ